METLLIAALAAGFVVSAIDYWQYLPFYRGMIALVVALLSSWAMGISGWYIPIYGAAAAFVAVSAIGVIDRAITTVVRR